MKMKMITMMLQTLHQAVMKHHHIYDRKNKLQGKMNPTMNHIVIQLILKLGKTTLI